MKLEELEEAGYFLHNTMLGLVGCIVLEMCVSSVKVLSIPVISPVTPTNTIIVQPGLSLLSNPSPDGLLLSLPLLFSALTMSNTKTKTNTEESC